MSGILNTLKRAAASASNLQEAVAPEGTEMRFTLQPAPGESGFSQWSTAMKMVAQLPEGIPPEFRCRLWLQLADKHLTSKGVDWEAVERDCFSEWSHPADSELGVQIVKDLHRTGCSLFCGEDGQENQVLLKRVLLAYARWNKSVGYCQGFNMLAALILQVTEKNESDALKLMIYLIEGVLPDSYFADSLRGLSVDMAVFRELLKMRLPRLSKHLDTLQSAAKEGTTSYEPPLTNVFTMQWFLTLFCNCLPQPTVLRVWDLILLEGNEILLRTALAIWQALAERITTVRSTDEFYCIMGVLTREMLEFGLVDANSLVKAIVTIGTLSELRSLREHYMYNINPWGSSIATLYNNEDRQLKVYHKERLVLDISALKKQYAKLKQRQKQAHIIFSAAVTRQAPASSPVAMNHLLLGKTALVPARRIGPIRGAIPPPRQLPGTAVKVRQKSPPSSSSSSDTELCDEPVSTEEDSPEDERGSVLADDSATGDSDTNLMTTRDNICATETGTSGRIFDQFYDSSRVIESSNQSTSDIFDSAVNLEQQADEDGFDFDRFLEERVRFMKQSEHSGNTDDDRIECARRNSQKALQIIQENSLILHRILQCQSRLTPSPPLEDDNRLLDDVPEAHKEENRRIPCNSPESVSNETVANSGEVALTDVGSSFADERVGSARESGLDCSEMCTSGEQLRGEGATMNPFNLSYWSETVEKSPERSELIESLEDALEGEQPSKFESIFQYSKDLDEKYNSLILNAPKKAYEPLDSELTFKTLEEDSMGSPNQPLGTRPCPSSTIQGPLEVTSDYFSEIAYPKTFEVRPDLSSNTQGPLEVEATDYVTEISDNKTFQVCQNRSATNQGRSKVGAFNYLIGISNIRPLGLSPEMSPPAQEPQEPSQIDVSDYFSEVSDKSATDDLKSLSPSKQFSFAYNESPNHSPLSNSKSSPSVTFEESQSFDIPKLPPPLLNSPVKSPSRADLSLDFSNSSSNKSFASPVDSTGDCSRKSPASELHPKRDANGHLKSPSRTYNPFPIQVTTRQNKDVAFRLGLYKK